MKIRNGFISNSSSSSFIIAFKENHCDKCGRSNDILKSIGYSKNEETNIYSSGTQNVVDQLYKSHEEFKSCYEDIYEKYSDKVKKDIQNNFAKITFIVANISKYAEEGYDIAYINVSYHDEYINELIRNHTVIIEEDF